MTQNNVVLLFFADGFRDTIGSLVPAASLVKSHWQRSFTLEKGYKQKMDFLEK